MLVFLWIFQTVFLESCYTIIKQHQGSQCASEIIESIESGNNTSETLSLLLENVYDDYMPLDLKMPDYILLGDY